MGQVCHLVSDGSTEQDPVFPVQSEDWLPAVAAGTAVP